MQTLLNLLNDAKNGSFIARLFLAVVALIPFCLFMTVRENIMPSIYMHSVASSEHSMTIKDVAPTMNATNASPLDWDKNFSRMLPATVAHNLAGVKIACVSQEYLNQHATQLGDTPQKSWDGTARNPAEAYYVCAEKTVYLSTEGTWSRAATGSNYSAVVHELGHALDDHFGEISKMAEYNFTSEKCFAHDHYFQSSSEAFAQTFSVYLTGDRSTLSLRAQKEMAKVINCTNFWGV